MIIGASCGLLFWISRWFGVECSPRLVLVLTIGTNTFLIMIGKMHDPVAALPFIALLVGGNFLHVCLKVLFRRCGCERQG